jgi:hypothetical protein
MFSPSDTIVLSCEGKEEPLFKEFTKDEIKYGNKINGIIEFVKLKTEYNIKFFPTFVLIKILKIE